MDILAHGVFGRLLLKGIDRSAAKRTFRWAVFWGVFPDLFAFTIPFLNSIVRGSFEHHQLGAFDLGTYLYDYSHSLVIFSIVFALVALKKRRWRLPLLAWGLHIVFDIPTHTTAFYPTPFLFPLSDYVFPYGIGWSTPLVWGGIWAAILVIYLALRYRDARTTPTS